MQLVSYIAPAAPATRRPARGDEPFLRPEVGFAPAWYRKALGIDFSRRWHADAAHRRETVPVMRGELRRRFGGTAIGGIDRPDEPPDLLTGAYGACFVAGLHGVPIVYAPDRWPDCEHAYLADGQAERLRPPDLDRSALLAELMRQVDWVAARHGRAEGFVNWQGVLNNAYRLRGEALFADMLQCPDRARRVLECVCTTMIDAARRLHARQGETGVAVGFFTVSNCLVNMVSPGLYAEMLLPFDVRIAEAFGCLGIHNCAWRADPYLDHYARVPHVGYIDMGLDSDLARAKALFPRARRAVMYTPMDLAGKPPGALRADFERIAELCGPCDVVLADVGPDTPDRRVLDAVELCRRISARYA